jgi:hypothetical protein
VQPLVGIGSCQQRHVGYLISGRLRVVMENGTETVCEPKQVYVIEPGYDAWSGGSRWSAWRLPSGVPRPTPKRVRDPSACTGDSTTRPIMAPGASLPGPRAGDLAISAYSLLVRSSCLGAGSLPRWASHSLPSRAATRGARVIPHLRNNGVARE